MALPARLPLRALQLSVLLSALWCAGCQTTDITRVRGFHGSTEAMPTEVSIVTWNAQKGQNPDFRTELAQLIENEQPDLVFIQEATADLLKSTRLGGYFAGSWSYPWPGGKTIGLLSLSRIPPIAIKPLPSRHREFLVTAPKLSLITEYPLRNGERLLAVNVHILAFERWSTRGMRRQLQDLEIAIRHHRGPVIFLGDLNTWSDKRLRLLHDMAEGLALQEVTDFPAGRRTGAGSSGWLRWLLGVKPGLALDRVFHRGFEAGEARVLPYQTSDHPPLLVTLSVSDDAPITSASNR